jgi:hypothetical protein
MVEQRLLTLEVLSGPLDGAIVLLQTDSDWSRIGNDRLCFPWDVELGAPQARFVFEHGRWYLEGLDAPHQTHLVNRRQRIAKGIRVVLEAGDLLKGGRTWLLVRRA